MTKDETTNANEEVQEEQTEETQETTAETDDATIKNLQEVAKKAQYDYVMLKYDFDAYQRRMENDAKDQKSQYTADAMKKVLPIIDQLSYSVDHMPEDLKGNTWSDGVKLVYDNAMKMLASLGIEKIATIGNDPDSELHEPLSVEEVSEESLKGKIVKEYEAGYTIRNSDGSKRVIKAAKVIVGQ